MDGVRGGWLYSVCYVWITETQQNNHSVYRLYLWHHCGDNGYGPTSTLPPPLCNNNVIPCHNHSNRGHRERGEDKPRILQTLEIEHGV